MQWLVSQLDDQKRRLQNLENRKPGLAYSSIEDGAIREYDKDGTQGSQIGKQHDGSHVAAPFIGPIPPAPVPATLVAGPGVLEVRWSGKFDGGLVSTMDWSHAAIYVGTAPDFEPDWSKQEATLRGELGDLALLARDAGTYYVRLASWSLTGKHSDASPAVMAVVPAAADADALAGKMTVATHAPTPEDGEEKPIDALWNQIDPVTDEQVAVWRWTGGVWVDFPISETMLPLVNIAEGTYGRLKGIQLEAKAIDGMVITGAIIQSPGDGAGYQLTEGGYTSRDANGSVTVRLPSDGTPAQFKGDIEAQSLTASGRVSLQAPENEIAAGAYVVLESGVSAPASPPTVGAAYETRPIPYTGEVHSVNTVGLAFADSLWWRASLNGTALQLQGVSSAGSIVRTIQTGLTGSNGITAIGNELHVLGRWDGAVESRHVAVYNAATGAYVRRWAYTAFGTGTYQPGIGTDGTNVLVAQSAASGVLTWRRYNKTSGALMTEVITTYVMKSDTVGAYQGTADFGAERVAITRAGGSTELYTANGTHQPFEGWYSASNRPVIGSTWANGKFWHLQDLTLIGYSAIAAPAGAGFGDTDDWWIAQTWTGTGGAETTAGAPQRFTFIRRSELQLSGAQMPPGATGAKFYLARKATSPVRTDFHLIATVTGTTGRLAALLSNWGAQASPPAMNTFPSGTPGAIRSRIGTFEARGDGSGRWGQLTFRADGMVTGKGLGLGGSVVHNDIPASGGYKETVVTFPAGRFAAPPTIVAGVSDGRLQGVAINATATSFTLRTWNFTGGGIASNIASWVAIEN